MSAKSRMVVAAAILFAVSSISLAAPANAQQRMASGVPRSTAVVHARPAATHAVASRPVPVSTRRTTPAPRTATHFNPATNSFQSSDGSFVSLQDLLNPVPGLGFDYQHLTAINQDLLIKAAIDPVTQLKLAEARRFLRGSGFGGPGFFLWDGGVYYPISDESAAPEPAPAEQLAPQQAQQPQMIVVQAPPAQQAAGNSSEESTPLPDVGQFTLVLRNGTQLQAIAFTRTNDRIVYITADGNRRTIAVADLNPDETMRINEERGTPLQFSL